ncbi:MAG: glycosyltransferase family 4 protein [Candidatus Methylacidiphilales bacterium]|nr:glycosyltransferase family 4 protein [Candidatus Methylacidiphilales bacterium]
MMAIFAGPFPPPVHGKALATVALRDALLAEGVELRTIDISEGARRGVAKAVHKLASHLAAIIEAARHAGPVYISVNSGGGMWLTTLLAGCARLLGRPLILHHHSYDYVGERRSRMVVLARAAGPQAVHLVLGQAMASDLASSTPEVGRTAVLGNAGLIDPALMELPKSKSGLVLGHLSNLSAEKGIAEVVETAIALQSKGRPVRLVIAGPDGDDAARSAIDHGRQQLGDALDYRGPVSGAAKRRFFADISHFLFPTRYRNEASPLVLLEAVAAGVPCIAFARGCIAEDLGTTGGVTVAIEEDFVAEAVSWLSQEWPQLRPRDRYLELLGAYRRQLDGVVRLMAD